MSWLGMEGKLSKNGKKPFDATRGVMLVLATLLAVCAQAVGKTYTWVGGSGSSVWAKTTNWKDASNKNGIPDEEDSAIIASGSPTFTAVGFTVGNLTISTTTKFNAAALPAESSVEAIATNPTVIKVVGKLTISPSTTVTVCNDSKTGAAVKFEVGELEIGESATLTAKGTGWQWYTCTDGSGDEYSRVTKYDGGWGACRALGPGYYSPTCGAGHGMAGKRDTTAPAIVSSSYGLKYAPFCPGSPGAQAAGRPTINAQGGGTIWIECTGGMVVNGTINADSGNGNDIANGASGGSIWLAAKSFSFGPAASLSAQAIGSGGYVSASGGRISLAQNVTTAQLALLRDGETPSELTYTDDVTLVTASVAGGNSADPRPGTVTTVEGPKITQIVTVQSSGVLATGVSPAYGSASHEIGSTQVFRAPEYGFDPANDLVRYECLGFVVSNETAQIDAGPTNAVAVAIGQVPLSVTWKWGVPERRTIVRKPANGSLRLNGETLDGDAVQWIKSGAPSSVEVVPDTGYEFLCWDGNAPKTAVRANPVVLDQWKIYDVTPILRTAGDEPTSRTWSGTGLWTDAAKWTPANLPGPNDAVTIALGTCTISNGLMAATLAIADGAVLKIGTAGDVNPYLTLAGDATLSGSGALMVGFGPNMTGNGVIAIGGDLALSDSAVLTLWGGPTNDVYSLASGATTLDVAGDFTLEDTAKLVLESEYTSGGSVKITAKTFSLAETATIDACGRGYRRNGSIAPNTPGTQVSYDYAGGSHGGVGQITSSTWGKTQGEYGFAWSPVHPGAPGASCSTTAGNNAGGLVRIHAQRMIVEGTVNANASLGTSIHHASAGGGIWLTADRFTFGTNAVLTAMGGKGSGGQGASGGGGRIAIGCWLTDAQIDELARTGTWAQYKPRRVRDEAAFRAELGNDLMTIDVNTMENVAGYNAPGTFTFVDGRTPGLAIFVK